MRLLALDTSSSTLSVAAFEEGRVCSEISLHHTRTHSENLMPAIEWVMQQATWRNRSLERIAVCTGPGSFTGIRIGVASANAMALALGIPCVGVSSLDTLALSVGSFSGLVFALADAQRQRLYVAQYRLKNGRMLTHTDPQILPQEDLLEQVQALREPYLLTGYTQSLAPYLPENCIAPEPFGKARAGCLAQLAQDYPAMPTHRAVPVYLRLSQAEIQWEERK